VANLRRAVVVILGVVLMVEALLAHRFPIVQFVVGAIMVGLVPIDAVIDLLSRPQRDEGEIQRLREVMREHEDDAGEPSNGGVA
jgi:hypothetical protein